MKKSHKNQEIVLAKRPEGVPDKSTFGFQDIEIPEIKDGEVLIKSIYVSVDPGMRGFMDEGDDDDRGNKYELGKPITSRSVAQVVESKDKKFSKDDIVYGRLDWKNYRLLMQINLKK